MERSSDTTGSDKDKRMSNTFESYVDTKEKDDDSKEGKPKRKKSTASESGERAQDESEQKKQRSLEAARDKDAEPEQKSRLNQLFEPDTEEAEPELPENLEEFSEDEARLIAQRLGEARDVALREELAETEPGSTQELEVLTDALYINELIKNLKEGKGVDDAEHEAADETIADLGVVEEAEGILRQAAERDIVQEAEDILKEELQEPEEGLEAGADMPEAELLPVTDQVGAPSEEEPENSPTSTSTTVTNNGVPVSGIHSSPHGRGMGAGGSAHQFASGGMVPPSFPTPNAVPSSPNALQEPSSSRVEIRYRRGADMLVGGIIGYLIGRRRGRIKTEERLLPIQKSLEKKVKELDTRIATREVQIRKLTSEKIAREGEDAKQKVTEKVEAKARAKVEARKTQDAQIREREEERTRLQAESQPAEKPEAPTMPEEIQETPEAWEAPEAADHAKVFRPERMAGVVLMGSEVRPHTSETVHAEELPRSAEVASTAVAKEIVHAMPETELLAVAAKIEIEGRSAKQLYEQGRVTKEDLREVVVEHVKGSGRAETVLAERLSPVRSETMEHLPREGKASQQQPDSGGVGGATPGLPTLQRTAPPKDDISAASDAIITSHVAEEQQANHTGTWIAVAAGIAALVAIFLVL